jgi:hypothetical protein
MDNLKQKHDATFKIVTGDWGLQSEKLQEKYPQLTDADLKYESGQEHALIVRVETRLNKKREEIMNILLKSQTVKA